MQTQTIEPELWQEFQAELSKVQVTKLANPSSLKLNSKSLHEFFELFLTKEFPKMGSLNRVLEKNLAVYIVQSSINPDSVVQKYQAMHWNVKPLLGWIKKVHAGDIVSFNLLEIFKWANEDYPEVLPLLEKAKQELAEVLPIESVPEIVDKIQEPIKWIAESLHRPSTISFLSSPAGKGKTWLALTEALCTASGISFLNKFKTAPTKVLYLDYENFDLIQSRLKMILKGLNKPASLFSNMHVLSTTRKFADIFPSLCKTIKAEHYQFLIIDTLREFAEIDENDSQQVSVFINALRTLTQETGICVLLLHHEGKGHEKGENLNRLRGSTALSGAADCVLQLNSDGEHMTIIHSKSRGARAIEPFYCNIIQSADSYRLEYAGFASELDDTKGVAFFKAWIENNEITLFSASEFWDVCAQAGISKSTSRRTLTKLAHDGIIRKESNKPRAKWQVYSETPPAPIEVIRVIEPVKEVLKEKPVKKNNKKRKGVNT